MIPLLQHISTHSTLSQSISFLPLDSSPDVNAHLLSLPSLRSMNSTSGSLSSSNLQNLLDTIPELPKSEQTGDKTQMELLYYFIESLLSSILFTTTSAISYCTSSSNQYLEKKRELFSQSDNDVIVFGVSHQYACFLSKMASTIFELLPWCWHLLGLLAHLPKYITDQSSIANFYLELERNLWTFKEYESSLQQLIQHDLYARDHIEKKSSEEIDGQFKIYRNQIRRIQDVILKILSHFPIPGCQDESKVHWKSLFSGEVIDVGDVGPELAWHQDINGTTLLMQLSLVLIDTQLHSDFDMTMTDENNMFLNCVDNTAKHVNRYVTLLLGSFLAG